MADFLMIFGLVTLLGFVFGTVPLALGALFQLIRDWWTGYKRPLLDEEVHERMVKEFTEAALAIWTMSPPPEDLPKFTETVYRELIERYSKELSEIIPGWFD